MHSVSWQLFHWDEHRVQGIDLPRALSDTQWTNLGALVERKGVAYALSFYDQPLDRSVLTAQPFVDGKWGDDVQLELHYDVHLQPSRSYCTEANCAALKSFAEKLVRQFDKAHDVSPLPAELSGADEESYKALLQHAGGISRLPRDENLASLPAFKGETRYADDVSYSSFGTESFLFPVHLQGELLLGRIGNASLGWRESKDLLLGVWRWNGQAFVPVLGMVTNKVRGDFLFGAWSMESPGRQP